MAMQVSEKADRTMILGRDSATHGEGSGRKVQFRI